MCKDGAKLDPKSCFKMGYPKKKLQLLYKNQEHAAKECVLWKELTESLYPIGDEDK